MKRKSLPTDTFCDAIPEIEQHEVRYSEYILKSTKNTIIPEKRQFLAYGVGPIIDSEIDDDNTNVNYSSYVLPRFDAETIHQDEDKTEKKELKKGIKSKNQLTLESIYKELHEMKLSKIHRIVNESKTELTKTQKNPPNLSFLSVAKQFYSTMFNPDQKYWLYMYIREILNIPPHEFRGVQHIYTVLAPIAAVIIFQKKYKVSSLENAMGKLAALELMNPNFYSDKAKVNIYCRT